MFYGIAAVSFFFKIDRETLSIEFLVKMQAVCSYNTILGKLKMISTTSVYLFKVKRETPCEIYSKLKIKSVLLTLNRSLTLF